MLFVNKKNFKNRLISLIVLCSLISNSLTFSTPRVYAQDIKLLASPGARVALSPAFTPTLLKGIKVSPYEPFRLDFIISKQPANLSAEESKAETNRLIKYFFAALTIPEQDLWVNLSPYEKNRIIPDAFGVTQMGRDLLAQDYTLKQVAASVLYPEQEIGKQFWNRVYAEARKRYGVTDITIDTFNKVWIIPEKAVVYEHEGAAFVMESSLKVLLEEDFLAVQKNSVASDSDNNNAVRNELGLEITREIVIPLLNKVINEGQNFAPLRQVYAALVLAFWYKRKVKESLLSAVYVDRNKVGGIEIQDSVNKDLIYAQYLEAFKKGAYNYIREDIDAVTGENIPRKYFAGGADFTDKAMLTALQIQEADPLLIGQMDVQPGLEIVVVRADSVGTDKDVSRPSVLPDNARATLSSGTVDVNAAVVQPILTMEEAEAAYNSSALVDLLGPWANQKADFKKIVRWVGVSDLLALAHASGASANQVLQFGLLKIFSLFETPQEFMKSWSGLKRMVLSAGVHAADLLRDGIPAVRRLFNTKEEFLVYWPVLVTIVEQAGRQSGYLFLKGIPLFRHLFHSPQELAVVGRSLNRIAASPLNLVDVLGFAVPQIIHSIKTPEDLVIVLDRFLELWDEVGGEKARIILMNGFQSAGLTIHSTEEFIEVLQGLQKMAKAAALEDVSDLFRLGLKTLRVTYHSSQEFTQTSNELERLITSSGPGAGKLLRKGLVQLRASFSAQEFREFWPRLVIVGLSAGSHAGDVLGSGVPALRRVFKDNGELLTACDGLVAIANAADRNAGFVLTEGLSAAVRMFTPMDFRRYWPGLVKMAVAAGPSSGNLFIYGLKALRGYFSSEAFDEYWEDFVVMAQSAGASTESFFVNGLPVVLDSIQQESFGAYWRKIVSVTVMAGPAAADVFRYGFGLAPRFNDPVEFEDRGADLVAMSVSVKPRAAVLLQGALSAARQHFTEAEWQLYWKPLVGMVIEAGPQGIDLLEHGLPLVRRVFNTVEEFAGVRQGLLVLVKVGGAKSESFLKKGLGAAHFLYNTTDEFLSVSSNLAGIGAVVRPNLITFLEHTLPVMLSLVKNAKEFKRVCVDVEGMLQAVGSSNANFLLKIGLPAVRVHFSDRRIFRRYWKSLVQMVKDISLQGGHLLRYGVPEMKRFYQTPQEFLQVAAVFAAVARASGDNYLKLYRYIWPVLSQSSIPLDDWVALMPMLNKVLSFMNERQVRYLFALSVNADLLRAMAFGDVDVDNRFDFIVSLLSLPVSEREKEEILTKFLEPFVFSDPQDLTEETLRKIWYHYERSKSARYFFYYVTASKRGVFDVKRIEQEHIRRIKLFTLHDKIADHLKQGRKKILIVNNIDDGQGDELIRVSTLAQSFLDFNPAIRLTILTKRPFLYDHLRVQALSIADSNLSEDVLAKLGDVYDAAVNFSDFKLNNDRYALAAQTAARSLALKLEQVLQKSRLIIEGDKSTDNFLFTRVRVAGEEYVARLGLDIVRTNNVYETTLRLIAELGLPLRVGEEFPQDKSLLDGRSYVKAEKKWQHMMMEVGNEFMDGKYLFPVVLINPYGGMLEEKGFSRTPSDQADLIFKIGQIVKAGQKVVILPNGQEWGTLRIAEGLYRALPLDVRQHCVVADEPAVDPKAFKYFLEYADYVLTVEGGMMHLAYAMGKPFGMLVKPGAGSLKWLPYALGSHQDVVSDLGVALRKFGVYRGVSPDLKTLNFDQAMLTETEYIALGLSQILGAWNDLGGELQETLGLLSRKDIQELIRSVGSRPDVFFKDSLLSVRRLFATPHEFKAHWPDLFLMAKSAGSEAGYLFDTALPDFFNGNVSGEDQPFWHGLFVMVQASRYNSGELISSGIVEFRQRLSQEDFRFFWPGYVAMVQATGLKSAAFFRDALPVIFDIFNARERKEYWQSLVDLVESAGESAGDVFKFALPVLRPLFNSKDSLREVSDILTVLVRDLGPDVSGFVLQYGIKSVVLRLTSIEELSETMRSLAQAAHILGPQARMFFRYALTGFLQSGFSLNQILPYAGKIKALLSLMDEQQVKVFFKLSFMNTFTPESLKEFHVGSRSELLDFLLKSELTADEKQSVLTVWVEPWILAYPEAFTMERVQQIWFLYQKDTEVRYSLYFLSTQMRVSEEVRVFAREIIEVRKLFGLHEKMAGRLKSGRKRVLVMHNVRDGQGDEIIRIGALVQGLLDYNPEIEVTLITERSFLYDHDRVMELSFADLEEEREQTTVFNQHFDMVVEHIDMDFPVNEMLLRNEAYVHAARQAEIFISSNNQTINFYYDKIVVGSQEFSEVLGLNRVRVNNVYEPTWRLMAELGFSLRTGRMGYGETLFMGRVDERAQADWHELMARVGNAIRDDRYQSPVVVLNPYGGQFETKGFKRSAQDQAALVKVIRQIVAEGFKVVILPNGTPWGTYEIAEDVLGLLPEDERQHCAVAKEPSDNLKAYKYFVAQADYVFTVEGGMVHLAYALGQSFAVLNGGPESWLPYSRRLDQGFVHDVADGLARYRQYLSRTTGGQESDASQASTLAGEDMPGGVSFRPDDLNVQLLDSGAPVIWHFDPALLESLRQVSGFTPVIVETLPLKSLPQFFGLNKELITGAAAR